MIAYSNSVFCLRLLAVDAAGGMEALLDLDREGATIVGGSEPDHNYDQVSTTTNLTHMMSILCCGKEKRCEWFQISTTVEDPNQSPASNSSH
jgi:hypothetical protein